MWSTESAKITSSRGGRRWNRRMHLLRAKLSCVVDQATLLIRDNLHRLRAATCILTKSKNCKINNPWGIWNPISQEIGNLFYAFSAAAASKLITAGTALARSTDLYKLGMWATQLTLVVMGNLFQIGI